MVRVVAQRVTSAAVAVDGKQVGAIDRGLALLVGFKATDSLEGTRRMVEKVSGLRIFDDADGNMNLSLSEVHGSMLVISQFTLYGDTSRGRRPSFMEAARPEIAEPLYCAFIEGLLSRGVQVATGRFGADMLVRLNADGPVTLILDSEIG